MFTFYNGTYKGGQVCAMIMMFVRVCMWCLRANFMMCCHNAQKALLSLCADTYLCSKEAEFVELIIN